MKLYGVRSARSYLAREERQPCLGGRTSHRVQATVRGHLWTARSRPPRAFYTRNKLWRCRALSFSLSSRENTRLPPPTEQYNRDRLPAHTSALRQQLPTRLQHLSHQSTCPHLGYRLSESYRSYFHPKISSRSPQRRASSATRRAQRPLHAGAGVTSVLRAAPLIQNSEISNRQWLLWFPDWRLSSLSPWRSPAGSWLRQTTRTTWRTTT